MIKIGLTGGIGSGKSVVATLFSKRGIPIISADKIAHQLTHPGSPQLKQISAKFGDDVFTRDGELDRKKMAQIIFSNPDKKEQLETILHPPIREAMHHQTDMLSAPYVILEIPLLLESGQYRDMDRVLLVITSLEIRKKRLLERGVLNTQQIEKIIGQQADDKERLEIADDVIENNSTQDQLSKQVERLHRRYLELSRREIPAQKGR